MLDVQLNRFEIKPFLSRLTLRVMANLSLNPLVSLSLRNQPTMEAIDTPELSSLYFPYDE